MQTTAVLLMTLWPRQNPP